MGENGICNWIPGGVFFYTCATIPSNAKYEICVSNTHVPVPGSWHGCIPSTDFVSNSISTSRLSRWPEYMVRTREIYIPREGGGAFQIVRITRIESISILNLLGDPSILSLGASYFLSHGLVSGEYADFP